MFHLSLPVTHYAKCLRFYRTHFAARCVELTDTSANLFVFGGQLTLHDRAVSPMGWEARQAFHFGQVVDHAEWERLHQHLASSGQGFLRLVRAAESPTGRAKFVVEDPSGNLVEINSEQHTRDVAPSIAS